MFGFNNDPKFKQQKVNVKKIGDHKLPNKVHFILQRTTEKDNSGKSIYYAYYNIGANIFLHGTCLTKLRQEMMKKLEWLVEEALHYNSSHTKYFKSIVWPLEFEFEIGKSYSGISTDNDSEIKHHILILDKYINDLNMVVYDVLSNGLIQEERSWSLLDNIQWTEL